MEQVVNWLQILYLSHSPNNSVNVKSTCVHVFLPLVITESLLFKRQGNVMKRYRSHKVQTSDIKVLLEEEQLMAQVSSPNCSLNFMVQQPCDPVLCLLVRALVHCSWSVSSYFL